MKDKDTEGANKWYNLRKTVGNLILLPVSLEIGLIDNTLTSFYNESLRICKNKENNLSEIIFLNNKSIKNNFLQTSININKIKNNALNINFPDKDKLLILNDNDGINNIATKAKEISDSFGNLTIKPE